jgi:hypothetical protein
MDIQHLARTFASWTIGKVVIAPNELKSNVEFYDYPAGGKPTKTLTQGFDSPYGSAISE